MVKRDEKIRISRGGGGYTKDICIAKHICRMLAEEKYQEEVADVMRECQSPKICLLWKIFFETGIQDTNLLEERIYQYGSLVKQHDYFSRELFVEMVSLLNHLKKESYTQ